MLTATTPGAMVWPAAMIVWGPGFTSTAHAHHCVQLILAMRGSLRVRRGPRSRWLRCGAVLVRPDAVHEVDAPGDTVVIGFIDAASDLAAALAERMEGDITGIPSREVAAWRAALGSPLTGAGVERWVKARLLKGNQAVAIDARVQRTLTYMRSHLGNSRDLSLKALAAVAGVSPSRFMHLFTESLGVPLRPYILWLRVQRAACDLMAGAAISRAVHSAGFSDAAHLTRTFRRLLGMTPSELALGKRYGRGLE
jgi:AraC-like DNA-binding protein